MSLSYKIVKIAKATKTFGANGEVVLRLFDTFPDEIDYKEPIFALINGLSVPLFFSLFQKKGNNKAVAIFDDIDTEFRALELIGTEFIAYEEDIEEEPSDELFYEDLIGYEFIDANTDTKGVITDFVESDLNPLFVGEINGKTIYIPANEHIIQEIGDNMINLLLPEGLLDLYL